MIHAVAILILAVAGLAAPAHACSTKASSTFCADGWVAQPAGRATGQDPAGEQADAWPDDGSGTDPSFDGDGVYVEGAVAVEEPPSGDDAEL